jgi:peptidoglycan/LPS O-acetylase OafA/YrhL
MIFNIKLISPQVDLMTALKAPLTHSKYRPDIDGLRALAVLAVVGFHAFPNWAKGGFIGVDIFFVISGYLISTIIFENLDKGTFTFSEFYARRIRRIFPALIFVLTACLSVGWFALLADEYKQLGKHIAAGAGFISNFILWDEAGYFDNGAETKPLLHLWSLGIEEQFYILWPVLLWFAWKRKFNLFAITLVVTIASFILNITYVTQDTIATFYSPQTRFWELLSGSLLAWLMLYKKQAFSKIRQRIDTFLTFLIYKREPRWHALTVVNILSVAGILLLVYGFGKINKELIFPGLLACIPVWGAVLIIAAGPEAWLNRKLLSNKIATWFGLISFPLYLWHWPLLSFARIVESETPSLSIRIAAVLVSVALAWFTYKFVERPLRFGKFGMVKVTMLTALMFIIGLAGYSTYRLDGFAFRMKDREQFVNFFENSHPSWLYFKKINLSAEWRSECAYFNGDKYLKDGRLEGGVADSKPVDSLDSSCYKRDSQFEKSVLVWGDSHAQSLSPGLLQFMPKNWQVLQIASSGCLPDPNVEVPSTESQCKQSNYFALKTIRDVAPDVVVIAQANGHTAQIATDISNKLKALGVKKVLFLGPTPQWNTELPKILARQLWITKPKKTHVGINQDILATNGALLRGFQNDADVQFVNVIGLFCDNAGCLTHTGDDIKESITTWDYGHLTPGASRYLAENLLVKRIVEQ